MKPTTVLQSETDAIPSDLAEQCRQLVQISDDELRRMNRDLVDGFKKQRETEVLGYMMSSLIDEILRLRRELRKASSINE